MRIAAYDGKGGLSKVTAAVTENYVSIYLEILQAKHQRLHTDVVVGGQFRNEIAIAEV